MLACSRIFLFPCSVYIFMLFLYSCLWLSAAWLRGLFSYICDQQTLLLVGYLV